MTDTAALERHITRLEHSLAPGARLAALLLLVAVSFGLARHGSTARAARPAMTTCPLFRPRTRTR